MKKKRWAWVLTGSGHFFNECISLINELEDVDVFVSKAAEEVLIMYKKKNDLSPKVKIYKDNSASSVSVGKFYKNEYHTLVMAPTSSNTVAKCVYGISDSLATNIFAQAGKCEVVSLVFACDTEPVVITQAPKKLVTLYPREIDLKNFKELKKFKNVIVVDNVKSLKKHLAKLSQ